MRLLLFLGLFIYCDVSYSQTVRGASFLQYRAYMIDMISETMQEVENFQWCNLKIPNITREFDYTYFGRELSGRVTFANGYVVTIQHLDIQQSTVQQVWNWNFIQRFAVASLKSTMRMHDVVLGFDVLAEINGQVHRYTSTFKHPMIHFAFNISKEMRTNALTVSVTGTVPTSREIMHFVPADELSNVLGIAFLPSSTNPGILAWGPDVFQPRALDVVKNKVPFPTVCYNC